MAEKIVFLIRKGRNLTGLNNEAINQSR